MGIREVLAGLLFTVAGFGGSAMIAFAPDISAAHKHTLFVGGCLLVVIGLVVPFMLLYGPRRSKVMPKDKAPQKPTGPAAISMINCKDAISYDNVIIGFDQGILDVNGENNRHFNNTVIGRPNLSTNPDSVRQNKARSKYFSGWRPRD